MTIVKYLLHCLVEFFDAMVGKGSGNVWLEIALATIIIAATFCMHFVIYWKIISPKCYKLWLCSVLTFLSCALIWSAFALFCIGGEILVRGFL